MLKHQVYFRCHTKSIFEQLKAYYYDLVKSKVFDQFDIETHHLPIQFDLDTLSHNNNFIIYFEIDADHLEEDEKLLNGLHDICLEHGHQIILICSVKYDFFEIAKKFNLGNIIMEDQFDLAFLRALTLRLLGKDFFGFKPFFPEKYPLFDKTYNLTGNVDVQDILKTNFNDFKSTLDEKETVEFNSFISELLLNALSYGVYGITPEQRDLENSKTPSKLFIPEHLKVEFRIVQDNEKYAISVIDKSGTLTLKRILDKIQRHTLIQGETLPKGISDTTGRGLFLLSRKNRLIINILNSVQTEIIVIHFNSEDLNKYQSLILNEKNPYQEE